MNTRNAGLLILIIALVAACSEPGTDHPTANLPVALSAEFDCGVAGVATVEFPGPESAELRLAGETQHLQRERTASGAKYATTGISIWTKGDEALLEIGDERYNCMKK